MKRIILLLTIIISCTYCMAQYVDLGLPSGTKWKTSNEPGFYNLLDAMQRFPSNLPTAYQFNELLIKCYWTWTGSGYKVVGPNGNYIYFPAEGGRSVDGEIIDYIKVGMYWSKTTKTIEEAYFLGFFPDSKRLSTFDYDIGCSVRLVDQSLNITL